MLTRVCPYMVTRVCLLYPVSGFGDILPNQEEVEGEVPTYIPRVVSFEMHSILADLKCQGAGISVGLYTGFNDTSNSDKECM